MGHSCVPLQIIHLPQEWLLRLHFRGIAFAGQAQHLLHLFSERPSRRGTISRKLCVLRVREGKGVHSLRLLGLHM